MRQWGHISVLGVSGGILQPLDTEMSLRRGEAHERPRSPSHGDWHQSGRHLMSSEQLMNTKPITHAYPWRGQTSQFSVPGTFPWRYSCSAIFSAPCLFMCVYTYDKVYEVDDNIATKPGGHATAEGGLRLPGGAIRNKRNNLDRVPPPDQNLVTLINNRVASGGLNNNSGNRKENRKDLIAGAAKVNYIVINPLHGFFHPLTLPTNTKKEKVFSLCSTECKVLDLQGSDKHTRVS